MACIAFFWPDPTLTTYDGKWCYYDRFSTMQQAAWHLAEQERMIEVVHSGEVDVYLRCDVQ